MIGPHLDSERIPAVAHGLARWSLEEAAHLERCAECRLEWNLVRTARALGRGPAERVALDRSVAAVARRLESAPAASPRGLPRSAGWILGAAAAAAIAVAIAYPRGSTPSDQVPGAEITVLNELDGLTPAELEAVLETIPPAADEAMHVEAAPIEDLSAQDLERMLRSLE